MTLSPMNQFKLTFLHRLGNIIGWLWRVFSPVSRKMAAQNLAQSGLLNTFETPQNAEKVVFRELGKAAAETPFIWLSASARIQQLVRKVHNWQAVEHAQAAGKGIIFLTPHMGSFEVTSRYYALHAPITVLYRPPKIKWLRRWVNIGRQDTNVQLAPANKEGVRKLMQALKKGEAIGILPDQIPAAGEGEWADFFGKPAYTMTLASKLAEKTGASIIMAFGERLANGEGYEIHLSQVDSINTPALLNAAIEAQIAQCPAQYLWTYNRYKISRKAKTKL